MIRRFWPDMLALDLTLPRERTHDATVAATLEALRRLLANSVLVDCINQQNLNAALIVRLTVAVPRVSDDELADRDRMKRHIHAVWHGQNPAEFG
jgi:hypothetical protein